MQEQALHDLYRCVEQSLSVLKGDSENGAGVIENLRWLSEALLVPGKLERNAVVLATGFQQYAAKLSEVVQEIDQLLSGGPNPDEHDTP